MTSLFYARNWRRQGIIVMMIFLLSACAELRLQTMPVPPASNKLRVFVQPISGNLPKGDWPVSHDVFSTNMYEATKNILNKKDIYQVTPEEDVRAVMGSQTTAGWQWEKNKWLLAKQVGKALYADYTLIIERGHDQYNYNRMVLINTETGKNFEAFYNVHRNRDKETMADEHKQIIRNSFREIFNLAKADMLVTAMRKGRVDMSTKENVADSEISEKKVPPLQEEVSSSRPPLPMTPDIVRQTEDISRDRQQNTLSAQRPSALTNQEPTRSTSKEVTVNDEIFGRGKTKLVVYDFNAMDSLRVVAIILAEALREELHQCGKFELINRENIGQVMDELKLQQTGLVDEKDAIRIGKWMSASETVTGNLAMLGNALILQAKRTDMATMATLSLGSLRADVGKEEALLLEMHKLAQILSK